MPASPRGPRTSGGASQRGWFLVDIALWTSTLSGVVLLATLIATSPPGSGLAVVLITPLILVLAGIAMMRILQRYSASSGRDLEMAETTPDQLTIDLTDTLDVDIRDRPASQLFGPSSVETDSETIAAYLTGARVLVVGAGGGIGSELCRQIDAFNPAELIMVDCSTSGLPTSLRNGLGEYVVADVRDQQRLNDVFAEVRPEVVFHAAGLTSLQLLEGYPEEAWMTNVIGTNNVLMAAASHGVTRFVNISSDRAGRPDSVLAYTESLAEQLTTWYANRSKGAWVSVRVGSVLGSSRELLDTLRAQLVAGRPIEVSHPDKTRMVTTEDEVCKLVLQAGASGAHGEVFLLDAARPVRVAKVATRLAKVVGKPASIIFTGLAKGETLDEVVVPRSGVEVQRSHPLISHVLVPALTPSKLGLFDTTSTAAALRSLREIREVQSDSTQP